MQQVRPDGIAIGEVVGYDSVNEIVSYIQNPQIHADDNGELVAFIGDYVLTGTAQATPTSFTGTLNGLDFIGGYATSEIIKNTGMLTYLTNIRPVKRNDMQTERISFVISF